MDCDLAGLLFRRELPPDRRIEYLERALKHAELVRVALEMIEGMDRDTRCEGR